MEIEEPKLSVQDFAAKIKAKYPEYKDIPDDELTVKVIAKHPEYESQVNTKKNSESESISTAQETLGEPSVSEPLPESQNGQNTNQGIDRARQSIERRRRLLEQGVSDIIVKEPVYQNPVHQKNISQKIASYVENNLTNIYEAGKEALQAPPMLHGGVFMSESVRQAEEEKKNIIGSAALFTKHSAESTAESFKKTAEKIKAPISPLAKFRDLTIGTAKTLMDAAITAGSVTPAGIAFVTGVDVLEEAGVPEKAIDTAMSLASSGAKKMGILDENSPDWKKQLLSIFDIAILAGAGVGGKKAYEYVKKKVPFAEMPKEAQEEIVKGVENLTENDIQAHATHPESFDLARKEKEILDANSDLGKVGDDAKGIVQEKVNQLEGEKQQIEQREVQGELVKAHEQTLSDVKSNLETESQRTDISDATKEAIGQKAKTMSDELKVGDTVEMDVKPKEVDKLTDEELQKEFDGISGKVSEAVARQKKSNTAITSTPENLLSEKDFIRYDDVKNELQKRNVEIAKEKVAESRAKRKAEISVAEEVQEKIENIPAPIKKTIATTRAYEGEVREGVKKQLESLGLTRDVEHRAEAKSKAKEFIESVGEETALEAVRNNDVSDAAGAYVWNELIESVDKKLSEAKEPVEIARLEKVEAELFNEFSRKALSGGRFSSALADIYASSDLGYNLTRQIEKYKEQNKGEIPADVEAKFRSLDKQIKELNIKLAEAEKRAEVIEVAAKDKKIKEASRLLASAIRRGKLSRPDVFSSASPASIVWDGAIEVVAKTVEATGDVAQAVKDGLDYIKASEWYKNSDKKEEAENKFKGWFEEKESKEQKVATGLQKQISEFERKIKEGDFSKKSKPELISNPEITRLRAEKLRLKNEFDKEFHKSELRNRTKAQRWKDAAWDAWGLTRVLRATGEFSFVGVQNLIYTVSHPLQSAQALKTALKLMTSEKRTEQFLNSIKSQEYYPEIKESKLSLTEPHAELTAREELFYSDWANMIWNALGSPLKLKSEKAHQIWKDASPFKAVERASVGFLDTMRVLRFLDGKQMLEKQGISFKDNPQAYKDMADVINTFTGRASIGGAERFQKQLTRIFFSPRLWASQIKTATPYAFYHFGKMRAGAEGFKPSVAQKMAISDFSKFVGLTTSMVALAHLGLQNEEDSGVETDPTSSDFGKIKLGETRVDPWGGRIQNIILMSRLIADSIKKSSGKSYPLGTPFKTPTRLELLVEMATNKLAPSASMFNKYLSSHENKEGQRIDKYGQPYEFSEELKENLYPIYWGAVSDLLKDDPNALDGLLAFYAFFGGGVNVYDKKEKPTEITKEPIKK